MGSERTFTVEVPGWTVDNGPYPDQEVAAEDVRLDLDKLLKNAREAVIGATGLIFERAHPVVALIHAYEQQQSQLAELRRKAAEYDRMAGEIRSVYDRCGTAWALGVAHGDDSDAQAKMELALELLDEIDGSPALEGLTYDDPEPDVDEAQEWGDHGPDC